MMLCKQAVSCFMQSSLAPAADAPDTPPARVACPCPAAGLVDVPAAVLNETGVLGIRATSPKARKTRLRRCFDRHAAAEACLDRHAVAGASASPPAGRSAPSQLCRSLCCGAPAAGGQPFVGMLDCGASFSALNWQVSLKSGSYTLVDMHFLRVMYWCSRYWHKLPFQICKPAAAAPAPQCQAAALAGLPPRGDRSYGQPAKGQGVAIIGMDGKPQVRSHREQG